MNGIVCRLDLWRHEASKASCGFAIIAAPYLPAFLVNHTCLLLGVYRLKYKSFYSGRICFPLNLTVVGKVVFSNIFPSVLVRLIYLCDFGSWYDSLPSYLSKLCYQISKLQGNSRVGKLHLVLTLWNCTGFFFHVLLLKNLSYLDQEMRGC